MHCPKCGQQQVSEDIRFCSRCGFLLTGIAEVISNNGVIPGSETSVSKSSPRNRGVKQGVFVFLLGFLVVPIVLAISIATSLGPAPSLISAFLFLMGAVLRVAYALLFESNAPGESTLEEKLLAASQRNFKTQQEPGALPPQRSTPVSDYISPAAGAWRDTNDLQRVPGSVTDPTTKFLEENDRQ